MTVHITEDELATTIFDDPRTLFPGANPGVPLPADEYPPGGGSTPPVGWRLEGEQS